MSAFLRGMSPDPLRDLLYTPINEMLVFIAVRHDHTEDLQHGVRKIGVPTTRSKTDLAKDLAV